MNIFIKTILFITTLSVLTVTSTVAFANKVAFIIVNDDSGVMTNMKVVPDLRKQMFKQLKGLKKKSRQYSKAELVFVSTSFARPIWHGKISDLTTPRADEVIKRTANDPDRCNQLGAAYGAARNTIVQLSAQGFKEIHIISFSSMISTPIPCGKVEILLPQEPIPVDWIKTLTPNNNVKSITFYAVNPNQSEFYTESLQSLMNWSVETGNQFSIHTIESSISNLRFGLEGLEGVEK